MSVDAHGMLETGATEDLAEALTSHSILNSRKYSMLRLLCCRVMTKTVAD